MRFVYEYVHLNCSRQRLVQRICFEIKSVKVRLRAKIKIWKTSATNLLCRNQRQTSTGSCNKSFSVRATEILWAFSWEIESKKLQETFSCTVIKRVLLLLKFLKQKLDSCANLFIDIYSRYYLLYAIDICMSKLFLFLKCRFSIGKQSIKTKFLINSKLK